MKASLSLLALSAITFPERASGWTIGQTVPTSSGPVNGHAASNATQVSEYLGIPFAAPPVGDLRWAPPQKYNGTSAINGTSFVRSSFKRARFILTQELGVLLPKTSHPGCSKQSLQFKHNCSRATSLRVFGADR